MKTKILLSLIAISFSFGGCYTSFSAREYEEETFGQVEESAPADSMIVFEDENGNLDTVYLFVDNDTEFYDGPPQDVTVVNNYYGEDYGSSYWVGGFFGFPRFYTPVAYYPYYDPFYYDPYYCSYYPPYLAPYYGGNIFIYGDLYVGNYYGNGYYPSPERYRTQQSHWTNLRNNDGGRSTSRKSRDSYRTLPVTSWAGGSSVLGKGMDLDRDMERGRVSKRSTELASLNKGGVRKANLDLTNRLTRTENEINRAFTRSNKTTKTTKVAKTRKVVKRESVQQSKPKRTSKRAKYTRQNTNRKRAYTEIQKRSSYGKRKNSSYKSKRSKNLKEVKSSSSNSRSTYKPRSSSNSNKTSRSSYTGNKSSSSRSSYSGSSSRSSSSRSSYSGSSSRSSSRSSYSRPSSSSSSRSSSARSSSRSSGSSSRSSGKRR